MADAFETLYAGQFTLSVQLIKPNNPVIPLTDAVPQGLYLRDWPPFTAKFSDKKLLSVIFEKRVKLTNAITYVLNQTRYNASLIRCSVRKVFEHIGEIA